MQQLTIYDASSQKAFKAEVPTRSNAVSTFMEYCLEQVKSRNLGIHIMYLDQQEITRALICYTDDGIIIDKPYRTQKNSVKGLY